MVNKIKDCLSINCHNAHNLLLQFSFMLISSTQLYRIPWSTKHLLKRWCHSRAPMPSHESAIVNKNRWLVISSLSTHGVAHSLIHRGKIEDFPSYCNIRKTKSQDILLTHMKWQGEHMHEPPPLSTCLITPNKPTGNCHNLSSRYHTPDFPCSRPIMQKRQNFFKCNHNSYPYLVLTGSVDTMFIPLGPISSQKQKRKRANVSHSC